MKNKLPLLHHAKHLGLNCEQSISYDYEKNSPQNLSETVQASTVCICFHVSPPIHLHERRTDFLMSDWFTALVEFPRVAQRKKKQQDMLFILC